MRREVLLGDGNMNTRQGAIRRTFTLLTLSPERWDRSKNLRQTISVAFVLCSLGAVGNWYNWLQGKGSLALPIGATVGLTVGALVALILTPRKWELLFISAVGVLGLEILAIVLRKGPLAPLLEAMAVTVAVVIVCQYIKQRLQDARHAVEKCHAESKVG